MANINTSEITASTSNSTKIIILFHVILWLAIIQLLFNITGLYYSFQDLFIEGSKEIDDAFATIPILFFLFYWNSLFLIPKYLNRVSWKKYLLLISLSFIFLIYLADFLYVFFSQQGYTFQIDRMHFYDSLIVFGLITIALSTSLAISQKAFITDKQKKAAEEKQKETELKYLLAQVNPHFLFNTLNSIYALSTVEDAPQTTEAILKLSEIMRYPLKEGQQKSALLSQEIKFIEDFIDLQKLRLGEKYPLHLQINIPPNASDKPLKIAPLLLIPFIENAFKYGISQQVNNAIDIAITSQNNQLHFTCKNYLHKAPNTYSHQMGIKNVQARLALLYPNKHELMIDETNKQFIVDLRMEL